MPIADYYLIVQKLKEENEKLKEQIRQLRADLVQTNPAFAGVLSRQQIALLLAILRRPVASYEYLDQVTAESGKYNRFDGEEFEQLRTKVAISKLRKKLKPFGISISTWRGHGYFLDEENRYKLENKFKSVMAKGLAD